MREELTNRVRLLNKYLPYHLTITDGQFKMYNRLIIDQREGLLSLKTRQKLALIGKLHANDVHWVSVELIGAYNICVSIFDYLRSHGVDINPLKEEIILTTGAQY